MILFIPDFFWVLIIKIRRLSRAKLWKYLKRKPWMLVMMLMVTLMKMPEAYAVNMTVKNASTTVLMTSLQTAVIVPTADIVSLIKGKKPISIPENEVITSEDTEDYLEEDSEEDYDTMLKKENTTGEFFCFFVFNYHTIYPRHHFDCYIQEHLSAVDVNSRVINDCTTCSAIQTQISASVPKTTPLK
jgi:hypothetical protein